MKTKFRILSAIMSGAIILSSLVIVLPVSAATTTDADLWSAHAATSFASDDAATTDVIEIGTAAELAYLATLVNAGTKNAAGKTYNTLSYKLISDIDATAHQWVAIGSANANYQFLGTFDGDNHKISTTLTDTSNSFYSTEALHGGLFGRIGANGKVKNLQFDFTYVYQELPKTKNGWFGGLAWGIYGGIIDNVHITLHITGTTKGIIADDAPVGGMAGYIKSEGTTAQVSNCSVGGTVNVSTSAKSTNYSQIRFASFFGAGTGNANTEVIIENCIATTDVTISAGGHQDTLGSLFARLWDSASNVTLQVNNFIDASKITTNAINGASSFHFGSLVGKTTKTSNTYATTQVFKVNGMVAMPTLSLYTTTRNTSNSGAAALIGSSTITAHATNFMTFENVYNTNPHLADIWMHAGSINVDANANGVLDASEALTVTGGHDGYSKAATFSYTVADGKTTVIISKGLYETFAAIGTVTVGHGDKKVVASAETYTVNANGDYEFTLDSEVGTAYMSVAQANGETVTLYDRWTSASTVITVPSGKGTAAAPYTITTPEELAYLGWIWNNRFGSAPATVYYELGNDIDLNHREWTPVGSHFATSMANADFRFKGGLDGQGYTIKNMIISDGAHEDDHPAAMFGGTANPTKLHDFNLTGNITVTDSNANSSDSIGVVSAVASGSTSIDNVHVDADVKVTITAGFSWVGGFVGAGNNVSITNSTMSGSVKVIAASGNNVMPCAGGFIGVDTGYEEIENCINYADVTVQANTSTSFAGGFIGLTRGSNSTNSSGTVTDNTYTVNRCVNYGTISVVKGLSGSANNQRVGGIIGQTGHDGYTQPIIVTNCVNLGEVLLGSQVALGSSSGVSQIVGFNEITGTTALKDGHQQGLTINNCYSIQADTAYAHYVYSPKLYTTSDPDKEIYVNGVAVEKDGSQEIPNGSMYFEIDTVVSGETATVTVYSKTALDVLLSTGFTMKLVYGDNTVTDLSDAAADGDTYVWTFAADGENKATLTATKTVGNATVGTKTVSTSARAASWAGMYAADSFANDDDTTDVIEIATAGELGLFARMMNMGPTTDSVKNAGVKLMADIDLAGAQWQSIGQSHTGSVAFTGSIDGNNKTISNLTLTDDHYIYSQSFIGQIRDDFTVQNLTFVDPVLVTAGEPVNEGLAAVTVLVGANYAENGLISNVDVVGMDMTIAHGMSYYGGIVGYLAGSNTVVENCDVSGTVTGTYTDTDDVKIGGIVARGRMGTVDNCISDIAINVTFDGMIGHSYVGGIVGEVYSNSDAETVSVTNCVSKGDIYVNADTNKTSGSIAVGVGGILGMMYAQGSFVASNNVVSGELAGTDNGSSVLSVNIGGIVGHNYNLKHGSDDTATNSATTLSDNYAFTTDKVIGWDNKTYSSSTNDTAWDVGVTTNGAASIRVDYSEANTTGIRFTSFIESALIESMKADSNVAVEFGTIVAPTYIINDYGMDVFRTVGVKIAYEVDKYAEAGNGVNGWAKVEGDNSYFTGALIGITDYTEEYTAVAYVTVTIDGADYTFYANYNNEDDRVRSISFVANAALKDRSNEQTDEYFNAVDDEIGGYSCYSDKQLKVIRKYIAE